MSAPLQRIAIVGATGRIGGAFAAALAATGKHTVTALTRPDSKGSLPAGVRSVPVNYDDETSLLKALENQQFLAITLGVGAPPDLHGRIAAAAAKAGVPYIMPNTYGYPVDLEGVPDKDAYPKSGLSPSANFYQSVLDRVKESMVAPASSIRLACGFWYEWSLATGEQWFGFRIAERKVTFFDDGKRTITVSTWDQCGRALAALLSLPESGASPAVADYKNGEVAIYSFRVSQRDMLDSLHRVMGTTDTDWEIAYESVEKRLSDGAEELGRGMFTGFAKSLYGGVFLESNKASDFAKDGKTANEVLGLPKEDLDVATKRAVDMVESGWKPF